MIPIQKGVPVPPTRKGGNSLQFPFRSMEIGDSFAVSIGKDDDPKRKHADVATAICGFKRTREGTGRQFTTRLNAEHTEIRVWRVPTEREKLALAPTVDKAGARVHLLSDVPPKRAGGARR